MTWGTVLFPFCLILVFAGFQNVASLFKLTNLYCESFNKSFVVVKECRLRAIKRHITIANINIDFLHPANKINLHIEILKKANGYKPFPVNTTIDACAFMKKRNDPIFGAVLDLIKEYTNINHTCPYMGQQLISGFYPKHELLKLPFPSGEYALLMTWYLYSKKTFGHIGHLLRSFGSE